MAQYTLASFEENVKSRLKDHIADLIPEDRYNELVRRVIIDFETKDLPNLVRAELTKRCSELIRAELNSPDYSGIWGTTGQTVSHNVKNMIVESAPLILAGLIGSACQNVVAQMSSQVSTLQNNGVYPRY